MIEESSLESSQVLTEQTYGELMDFESFEHEAGQVYGDLDVLADLDGSYLYIEVKTNPSQQDLSKSEEQLAKAAYLLDPIEYTVSLTDSQIDQLTVQEISEWDLDSSQFDPPLYQLTLKDAQKSKPGKYTPSENNDSDILEVDIKNEFEWSSDEVMTENLPNQWPRPRHLTV